VSPLLIGFPSDLSSGCSSGFLVDVRWRTWRERSNEALTLNQRMRSKGDAAAHEKTRRVATGLIAPFTKTGSLAGLTYVIETPWH